MLSWLGSLGILVIFFSGMSPVSITNVVDGAAVLCQSVAGLEKTGDRAKDARSPNGSRFRRWPKPTGNQAGRCRAVPHRSGRSADVGCGVRREPLLEQAWFHYRKTFMIERTAWFIEPRVFSTRAASEFFSQDVLSTSLNVAFYHQLPSLITGIGLLFTFLAILIGLSKLHADGSQIVGIQGLINGLAGKFLDLDRRPDLRESLRVDRKVAAASIHSRTTAVPRDDG